MSNSVQIVKADNSRELFRGEKLVSSLTRSGASVAVAEHILAEVEKSLHDGMTTSEIYQDAFKLLRKTAKKIASRYSLRHAILELGPTGFPFERFIAEVFRLHGYETEVGLLLDGKCIDHELDVVAKKDGKCVGMEAKFHNRVGERSDVKVALYVHARFEDLRIGAEDRGEKCMIDDGWLITNTKFTKSAIKYGECVGIKLVGWAYPSQGNLQDLVEEVHAHPVTALTTLSKAEKNRIIQNGVVMCTKLVEDSSALSKAGITGQKAKITIEEVGELCAV